MFVEPEPEVGSGVNVATLVENAALVEIVPTPCVACVGNNVLVGRGVGLGVSVGGTGVLVGKAC